MGITIDKSGFWWKLHESFDTDQYTALKSGHSVSLCSYFWVGFLYIILCFVVCFVVCIASIFVAYLVLFGLYSLLVLMSAPYTGWWGFGEGIDGWAVFGCFIGTSLYVIALSIKCCFAGSMRVVPYWVSNYCNKITGGINKPTTLEPKTPSIIKQYYKAYKERYCPLLKLED